MEVFEKTVVGATCLDGTRQTRLLYSSISRRVAVVDVMPKGIYLPTYVHTKATCKAMRKNNYPRPNQIFEIHHQRHIHHSPIYLSIDGSQ